jgi:hypothetical protein
LDSSFQQEQLLQPQQQDNNFSSSITFLSDLSESPSTIAAVTNDKILSIDLEASSFYILLHEDQNCINHCKTGMFNFELLIAICSALISTTNNAAGSLDMSAIEPKFFSNLARDDLLANSFRVS